MAGEIFRALQRQNNMQGFWGNLYNFALGKGLKKYSDKTKKKFDPGTEEPGVNLTLPDVKIEGKEVQPDIEVKPKPEKKVYDPTVTEKPGAGAQPGGDGPGFIPEVRTQQTPGVKQAPQQTGKLDYTGLKLIAGQTPSDVNSKINSDLQDFIAYASKFGGAGMPYIQQAMNIAALNYEKPKEYKESEVVNVNGIANSRIFDPTTMKSHLVPIKDASGKDVKYDDLYKEKALDIQLKEEKLKPEKTPVELQNGMLGFGYWDKDNNWQIIETETPFQSYGANPLAYAKMEHDVEMAILKDSLKDGNKKNKGGDGTGDGSSDGTGKGNQFTGEFVIEDDAGNILSTEMMDLDGKGVSEPYVKLPTGQLIKWETLNNYIKEYKKGGPKFSNINLSQYGVKIRSKKDKVNEWEKTFNNMFKAFQSNPNDPNVLRWVQNPGNINMAKSLGYDVESLRKLLNK